MVLPPSHDEIEELARMALAAMDSSESIELPLDYLQGHKDGLEWASQLAEANHPETGDWLYDDPIELAKAIRKGPDMSPAQPAPVVDADDNFYSWFGREWAENYQHNQYTTAAKQMLGVMAESAWKAGRRAAMLQAAPDCTCPSGDGSLRWPCPVHAGNSPAIGIDLASGQDRTVEVHYVAPPGYVMVPKEPTEAMMLHNSGCQHHAWDDPDCAMRQTRRLIWSHMLAAAPQSPGSEPATVPGKWIPVSERMPDETQPVIVVSEGGVVQRTVYQYCEGVWSDWYDMYDDVNVEAFTHWMPLPAAPQGVIHG
ncbi:DUF551 domain-containing protein [Klebsiella pneumoniae]|uniref:DUF551 domain-containing protein n=2 Tax=Klebsiella pneumoniae TaxID=573 RepID=UPI0032B2A47C